MTVDIDALLAKYPPKLVGLYGNCMVIPAKEFDSMWEAELRRMGFATFAKFGNEFGDSKSECLHAVMKVATWQLCD